MEIKKKKPGEEELSSYKVRSWPVWEKESSEFDWFYDQTEECFILEGQAEVRTETGETITFGVGDFVTFPQGVKCVWKITSPIKKHYNFK